jgi:uncharacterized protein YndB with AHSA1/START domain
MTRSEASVSDEVGAELSAWDGYITGRNLELVPGERIVQSWRTTEFTDEHEDSIITLTLEEVDVSTYLRCCTATCRIGRRVTSRAAGRTTILTRRRDILQAVSKQASAESRRQLCPRQSA